MLGRLFGRPRGPFTLTIETLGRTIEVGREETILAAAERQGLRLPHSCRVGSCTTCRCRLTSGTIEALTDTAYVLERDEMARGVILACQSRLTSDASIAHQR